MTMHNCTLQAVCNGQPASICSASTHLAYGCASYPRTSHHISAPPQNLTRESACNPVIGPQFIPTVYNTRIKHAFASSELLSGFPEPHLHRQYTIVAGLTSAGAGILSASKSHSYECNIASQRCTSALSVPSLTRRRLERDLSCRATHMLKISDKAMGQGCRHLV